MRILLVIIFFSQAVSAEDYFWRSTDSRLTAEFRTLTFSSPAAGCNSLSPSSVISASSADTFYISSSSFQSPTSFRCIYSYRKGSGGLQTAGVSFVRGGDSCPSEHTYDASVGECISDQPSEPPQDCSNLSPGIFKSSDGPITTVNGRRWVASRLEGQVCYSGCWYDIAPRASSCFAVPGSSDTGFCNYLGTGNGDNCSLPDAELGRSGDSLNPPAEVPDPDEPPSDPDDPGCHGIPGYVWNGTTCVKAPTGDGGGDNGGDSGGDNGGDNGGGNNGGGDNGGNNGGGDGSGNGNGSGDGDGNSGGSTGGGNGNGNGSGDGDGDGEGSGGPGGGGVPGVCEDGVCQFEPPEGFGDGEVPGFGESLEQVFKGIQESPIGQAVTSISFPSGGTCPVSSVSLLNTSITFDSHCDLWGQIAPILSAVFLAVWALLAVRIFLSA